jgi:hypothetical protein
VSHACKKFQILSWNVELLDKITFNLFGDNGLREIKFRIAKRLMQVKTGTLPMDGNKEKQRWMIETESEGEESSDYFTSNDEDQDHVRHDGGSSADEENRLKDFLRRNAKEERAMRRQATAEEE